MSRRKTTEEFKQETIQLYGDLFSFDGDTVYINNKTKVSVICKYHGKVSVQPDNFLNKKSGCPKCNRSLRKTTEQFIKEANEVHKGKYIYTKSEYINNHTKLCIICPIHGKFWITPFNHLNGKGCGKCSGRNFTSEERIEKLNDLYDNFYDYSKSDFSKVKEKTIVTCSIHGDFDTNFDLHYNHKHGCPKCGGRMKLTQEEFIERLISEFGDIFDTSRCVYKNMHEKVKLICPVHGEFQRTPIELLYHHRGCQKCSEKPSSLEDEIKELLIENNIKFEPQHSPNWLGLLSLDFYLPDYNIAIECQGKQHFGLGGWSNDFNFEEQKERDERKFNLCKDNNVKLLYFSNLIPNYEYFDKVYIDKTELLESIRYLYVNNNDLKIK